MKNPVAIYHIYIVVIYNLIYCIKYPPVAPAGPHNNSTHQGDQFYYLHLTNEYSKELKHISCIFLLSFFNVYNYLIYLNVFLNFSNVSYKKFIHCVLCIHIKISL